MELNQESIIVIITALLAVSEALALTKLKSNSILQMVVGILKKGKSALAKKEEKKSE